MLIKGQLMRRQSNIHQYKFSSMFVTYSCTSSLQCSEMLQKLNASGQKVPIDTGFLDQSINVDI